MSFARGAAPIRPRSVTCAAGGERGASPDATAVVDAVFLTSNSCDQAMACIAHLDAPEIARIVVVDNASADGTADAIRAAYPDVQVLALDAPTGLATAMNLGAACGTAPFVLYLNDDVFAQPGAVGLLLGALRDREDAVAAGGRLVDTDLSTQDRYRPRSFPSPPAVVARLLGLDRLWPRNPLTGGHLRDRLGDRAIVAVDQPAGACMLVRRTVAEHVGGWDERYWFWYEDVDFSRRLAEHGTRLYVPAAAFRHVGGATAGRLRRAQGHQRLFHGVLIYAESHFSWAGRALVAVALGAVGGVRALMAMPGDREAARIYRATVRAAGASIAGRDVSGLRAAEVRDVAQAGAPCPVCGASAIVVDRFRPTKLRECPGCGLLFRAEPARAEDVTAMYSDESYAEDRCAALTHDREHDARRRAAWTRARVAGSRLLDVGAGSGFFVAAARGEGFSAIGVEPSDLSARYARTQLGVDVRTGFLDTAGLSERDFDVVCMWHVLEHAPDPLALLRDVHVRLRPGGRLVVEVPNIESVGARLLGGRWAHLDPTAHVCHFRPRSMAAALQTAGYTVVELGTLVEGYYDTPVARRRPRRIAGRVVRALHLRTLRLSHPRRGELLRVVAERAP